MAFVSPGTPNLADFLTFLAESVQIPSVALPASSPWPGYAFDQAMGLVLNPPCGISPGVLYTLAVYNCATHLLLMITPDQPNQSFFKNIRGNNSSTIPPGLGLNAPSTGLVVSTFDQSSGTTLTAPTWADGLTIGQLSFFKSPWGQAYLSWQQTYGPSIVGLT